MVLQRMACIAVSHSFFLLQNKMEHGEIVAGGIFWGRPRKGMGGGREFELVKPVTPETIKPTTIMRKTNWTVGGSMVWGKTSELARIEESWISSSDLLITCSVTLDNLLHSFRPWFLHQYKETSPAHLAYSPASCEVTRIYVKCSQKSCKPSSLAHLQSTLYLCCPIEI